MIKKFLLFILIVLIVIQFIHPSQNRSEVSSPYQISSKLAVSLSVQTILKKACNDCHSNNTVYPWYSKLQPVDWWMNSHIRDGKEELNFDEFAKRPLRSQYRKLTEIKEQVEKGEMPLDSYTWIHKDAILDEKERKTLIDWVEGLQSQMESIYPMDSLIRKK